MSLTIDDVLSKLDPKTRARVQSAVDVSIQRQPTPSLSMNLALKGGLGFGRQVLLWGNKSSGKSSFCLQMIGEAQKAGKVCAWIDSESSYDPEWAERLGVDSEKLIYSNARSMNAMVDVVVKLMELKVDIIIVDSISAPLPAIYFEKDDGEMKQLQDTKQIGAEAKDMTHAVKMFNYANDNTLLVLISQQRNSFGSMYATHIPTGGMATKFFSSTVIKLWASESEKAAKKGQVQVGDKFFEELIGREVNWEIEYNKLGPMNLNGKYDFYYQGDEVGVDTIGDALDTAEKMGIVKKGGAWYTLNGEQLQGRPKAVEYLKTHPELVEQIIKDIDDKIQ